jgi:hypothetical protein
MIYVFQVQLDLGTELRQYIAAWKRGSEVIQRSAGARGIRLYQKIGSQDKLLNIATWDSKISRDMAMEALRRADAKTQALLHRHEDFGKVTFIGAFDEIASVFEEEPAFKTPKNIYDERA